MEAMRSNESVSKIRQIWFSISAFYTRVCSYILEFVIVHLSQYLSIQTHTRVCSFQRQTIVTWTFKDILNTRVCKYVLEYGIICEKIFKLKNSQYLSIHSYTWVFKTGVKLKIFVRVQYSSMQNLYSSIQ